MTKQNRVWEIGFVAGWGKLCRRIGPISRIGRLGRVLRGAPLTQTQQNAAAHDLRGDGPPRFTRRIPGRSRLGEKGTNLRRLAAMRWTRGMSVTFSSTCERRSITIGRALCEGRRGGRRGRAGSGTVGFVSSDLTKAWLRSGQGLDQVIEFALERLRTIHRRGDLVVHKLAECIAAAGARRP